MQKQRRDDSQEHDLQEHDLDGVLADVKIDVAVASLQPSPLATPSDANFVLVLARLNELTVSVNELRASQANRSNLEAAPTTFIKTSITIPPTLSSKTTSRVSYCLGAEKGLVNGEEVIDLELVVPEKRIAAGFGGDYIKSFVFGGLDGIVSTFALIASLGGAQVGIRTLIAVSIAKILADAFSMGFGEFTSANAELEHTLQLRRRQVALMEANLDGEVKELATLYIEKGCTHSDTLTIISMLANYKDLFLEHILFFMHGVVVEEDADRWQPLKQGFVCFLAFTVFGIVPLIGFIIFFAATGGKDTDYWGILGLAYGLTVFTLFTMGLTKAKLTGSTAPFKSGLLMVINGTIAGGVAFGLGEALGGALEGGM